VREDVLNKQFRIEGFNRGTKRHFLLGTAPTMIQAVGKATVYTEQASGDGLCDLIVLRERGKYLAQAEFQIIGNFDNSFDIMEMLMAPYKLKWDFEKLGEDLSNLRIRQEKLKEEIRKTYDPKIAAQLKEQCNEIDLKLDRTAKVSERDFTKAVFAVEKALGLQWNRASKLEDALGL
jgi:hypothetical protein